mmetsp:Transcript_70908/g.160453  ORF Transcript_70908/g.160453 Transcript_70908/m.160453 type:complete len:276 (+) Transcript_70908:651-1478(+)
MLEEEVFEPAPDVGQVFGQEHLKHQLLVAPQGPHAGGGDAQNMEELEGGAGGRVRGGVYQGPELLDELPRHGGLAQLLVPPQALDDEPLHAEPRLLGDLCHVSLPKVVGPRSRELELAEVATEVRQVSKNGRLVGRVVLDEGDESVDDLANGGHEEGARLDLVLRGADRAHEAQVVVDAQPRDEGLLHVGRPQHVLVEARGHRVHRAEVVGLVAARAWLLGRRSLPKLVAGGVLGGGGLGGRRGAVLEGRRLDQVHDVLQSPHRPLKLVFLKGPR